MLGTLVPCGGGPPITLSKPQLVVGRDVACDIRLSFQTVSARHCLLAQIDGFWFVRDLGSRNGIRVNGAQCTSGWLLPDDVLTVDQYRYRMVYAPPVDRPAPPGAKPSAGSAGPRLPASKVLTAKPAKPGSSPALAERPEPAAFGDLVPCGGGDPIPLRRPRLLVGRNADCDIILRFGTVSRHHCQLEWLNASWFVRDLGSLHGTRVDGVPCEEKNLKHGCILGIADRRFQVFYPGTGDRPAPVMKSSLFGQSLLEKAGLAGWQPKSSPPRSRERSSDPDEPRQRYTLGLPDQ